MLERYAAFIYRWRFLVVFVSMLGIASLSLGLGKLRFKNDYRMFFSSDNPDLIAFERLQNTFSKDDNVLVVLTPKAGDVFEAEFLALIEDLTKSLWKTPYSTRVDSVTNFQYSHAEGDNILVEDLVSKAERLPAEKVDQARKRALGEPLLVNRLISADGKVTGINVTVQRPGQDENAETAAVVDFIRGLTERLHNSRPDVDVRLTGDVMMDAAFGEASEHDMSTLTPAMLTLIVVMLYFYLRSAAATFAAVLMMTLSIVGAVGAAGVYGIAFSPSSVPAPTILLTLAVADAVHIITSYSAELTRTMKPKAALIEAVTSNFKAVFVTNLTTGISFLSMNFSDAPPFRDLGNITAIGVVIAFVLTVTLLPALLSMLPIQARPETKGGRGRALGAVAEWVIRYPGKTAVAVSIAALLAVTGISRNELDDEYVKYFDSKVEFRRDTDYTTDHLTGIYRVDYSLDSGESGGISDPAFLDNVAKFVDWWRQQPETMHVYAITDIMKRLGQNMQNDRPDAYGLPQTRGSAAQYLLLYEMSLPYGLDLNDRINVDKSATRLSVSLRSLSSQQILALEDRAQAWLSAHAANIKPTRGTGTTMMFARIGQRNIISMISGELFSIALVSLTLMLVLRSISLGLLSLIPNLLPAAIAFGIWGFVVGRVGLASSVVAAMTLGILVDDTVHFLAKYLHGRRALKLEVPDAVRYAFTTVGYALWVTSVSLVVGFALLAFSSFKINAEMGLLTAVIFALGLATEFLLLPPLLILFASIRTKVLQLFCERHPRRVINVNE